MNLSALIPQGDEERKNLDQYLTIDPLSVRRDEEVKNVDTANILKGYNDSEKLKKVWATVLDLDEKTSDSDLLYYIDELMKLGRIFEAKELADKLPAALQQQECVRSVLEEKRIINKCIKELENQDGWVLQVDGKDQNAEGISVWYRNKSDSSVIEVKSTFRVEANLAHIACIANEIDLWPMFLSRLVEVETKDCARWGFNTLLPYINIKFLWPMSHRECYFAMRVYDLIAEEKKVVLCCQDVGDETKYLNFKIPPVGNNKVRMKTKVYSVGETINSKTSDVTLMFSVDLAMPVPQSFVNWITRHVTWHIFKELRKVCVNLPNSHVERMKVDKTGVYKYLGDRLRVLFKNKT